MKKPVPWSDLEIRRVSAESMVDVRTIRRALGGERVRDVSRERIRGAANKLKLKLPAVLMALLGIAGCSLDTEGDRLFGSGGGAGAQSGGAAGVAGEGSGGIAGVDSGTLGDSATEADVMPSCDPQAFIGADDPCGPGDTATQSCVEVSRTSCYRCTNGGQKAGCAAVVNVGASPSAPGDSWWCC